MYVAVASGSTNCVLAVVAASAGALPSTVGDPGDLLHLDMDELTRPVTLEATNWRSAGGAVTSIQPGQSFGTQDLLHRRRSEAELMGDVVSSPTPLLAEPHNVTADPSWCSIR